MHKIQSRADAIRPVTAAAALSCVIANIGTGPSRATSASLCANTKDGFRRNEKVPRRLSAHGRMQIGANGVS